MAWVKNGSTTLPSQSDDIDTGSFTATKFNMFMAHCIGSGNIAGLQRVNGDTDSNYASRFSVDGVSENLLATQPYWYSEYNPTGEHDIFGVGYIVNIANEEKLQISNFARGIAAGAGTAPSRQEHVGKYVPSPEADMTSFQMRDGESGGYATDSNLTLLGTD
jgi:hypothetical protein